MSGVQDVVIAGGVESMTRVPMGASAAGGDYYGSVLKQKYPGFLKINLLMSPIVIYIYMYIY